MTKTNITMRAAKVGELMNGGDFESALLEVRNVQRESPEYRNDYACAQIISSLLIDIGYALQDMAVVSDGVMILRQHYDEMVADERYAFVANYCLANGLSSIFSIKRKSDPYYGIFCKTERDEAAL